MTSSSGIPSSFRRKRLVPGKINSQNYLRFEAKRGWLNIGSSINLSPYYIRRIGSPACSLNDGSENWVGVTRIHSLKPTGFEEPIPESRRVEMIAIATGKVRNNAFPKQTNFRARPSWIIPEWDCEERPKEEFYEFYFVLSIDWHGQRMGLGRVDKKVWERLPLDEIEVTLDLKADTAWSGTEVIWQEFAVSMEH